MKNKIIQFVKKHPFLYNMAKRINRNLKRMPIRVSYTTNTFFYTYVMKDKEELELIKKHYKGIKKYNTKLLIVIDNPKYNICINKFIRENIDVLFASLDYFKIYHEEIKANRLLILDYNKDYSQEEILNYLQ